MKKSNASASDQPLPRRKRLTADAREKQLIALAYDAAEERIRNGTATGQEITYFLKLGSSREKREQKLAEEQYKLMRAKTKSIENAQISDGLYQQVIDVIQSYRSSSTNAMISDEYYNAID